jgi:hypothetical protein
MKPFVKLKDVSLTVVEELNLDSHTCRAVSKGSRTISYNMTERMPTIHVTTITS